MQEDFEESVEYYDRCFEANKYVTPHVRLLILMDLSPNAPLIYTRARDLHHDGVLCFQSKHRGLRLLYENRRKLRTLTRVNSKLMKCITWPLFQTFRLPASPCNELVL